VQVTATAAAVIAISIREHVWSCLVYFPLVSLRLITKMDEDEDVVAVCLDCIAVVETMVS